MSDAKGNQSDPADGDLVEDAVTSADSATPETVESEPSGEATSQDVVDDDAAADAGTPGADESPTAAEDVVAEEPIEPAAAGPAVPVVPVVAESMDPEPAVPVVSAPADSEPIDAEPEAPAKAEPDYAALAAELEEFEKRTDGTLGATPAEAPEETAAASGQPAPGSAWFEKADNTFKATEPEEPETTATTVIAPAVTPSEPVAVPPPVFVEAPEPPRKRGNRLAALLIAVPATVTFAVLYLAAAIGYGFLTGYTTFENIVDSLLELLATPAFWVPVAVFFLAFWLVGVIVNRGKAAWWVVLGFFVGVAAYAGYVFGPVLTYPFWMVTASGAREAVVSALLHPVAIASFVIGREVTVWFGAWVARRGRRMVRLNAEDKAEYDNALEATE